MPSFEMGLIRTHHFKINQIKEKQILQFFSLEDPRFFINIKIHIFTYITYMTICMYNMIWQQKGVWVNEGGIQIKKE